MLVAAAAVVLAGITATARPAKADDAEDILRFLAGAIVIGAIVNAIDDNSTPAYTGRWSLPGQCLETIRVNGRNINSYNARCLNRAGYDNLPRNCRYEFRVQNGRTRTGYIAECLYDAGYSRHSGGWSQPPRWDDRWDNDRHPPYGGRPPHAGSPGWQRPITRLPNHCSMHYRMNGNRVDGYWANCLENAGFYNLPGYCQVRSTDGQRIYTGHCLRQEGYQ
ncbi:hypothetical protein [Pararhodobacter sp.]|uniref:hypothetical protein n=1 Tax=Pararhodobacter sp. TaxID=2127056 RepID=UPI002FE175D8|nr:hypothetical protein [Pseudomonadota bacterium]